MSVQRNKFPFHLLQKMKTELYHDNENDMFDQNRLQATPRIHHKKSHSIGFDISWNWFLWSTILLWTQQKKKQNSVRISLNIKKHLFDSGLHLAW